MRDDYFRYCRECLKIAVKGVPILTVEGLTLTNLLLQADGKDLQLHYRDQFISKTFNPSSRHEMNDSSSFALESLILFQNVAAYGATQQSFARISDALKSSNLRQASSLNEDRYDAKALTETFLRLLKAEAKTALRNASSDVSRKSPSPKLSSVEDAASHIHLIPGMIPKLYDQYKRRLISEVREDEKKYQELVADLKDLKDVQSASDKQKQASHPPRPSSSDKAKLGAILNKNDDPPRHTPELGVGKQATPTVADTARTSQSPYVSQSLRPSVPASPTHGDGQSFTVRSSGSPRTLPPPNGYMRPPQSPAVGNWSNQQSLSPHRQLGHGTNNGAKFSDTYNAGLPTMDQQQYPRWMESPYASPFQGQSSIPALQQQRHSPFSQVHGLSSQPGGVHLPPSHGQAQSHLPGRVAQSIRPMSSFTPTTHQADKHSTSDVATPGPSFSYGSQVKSRPAQASPALANILNQQPAYHFSPGSRTPWRGPPTAATDRARTPSVEPLSEREGSPQPTAVKHTVRRSKPNSIQLSRENAASGRRGSKTPSIPATSTSQGRTRSQSIASFADDMSIASGPGTFKGSRSSINTPTPGDRPLTRHARNMSSTTTATAKRKRRDSTADSFVTAEAPPSPLPSRPHQQAPEYIVASRNFQRMTAPLMENIASHKVAAKFAGPVSAKTRGYYETIYRPTDLKTIKGQINQGNRAVIAAAASVDVSSPGGESADTGTTVTLPYSEELEPPKAIVNADQLEQELMRMFANAAMFNEGDGGVVAQTREMCEDVLKVLADFRGAEGGARL